MGGKDAIVVDADADLDSAVEGVATAAFGFQGQKCSACSRAIIDERIYDKFLERLKDRVERISIGDPATNTYMGAVINEGSMKSILTYIEIGKHEGKLELAVEVAAVTGMDGFPLRVVSIACAQIAENLHARTGEDAQGGPQDVAQFHSLRMDQPRCSAFWNRIFALL